MISEVALLELEEDRVMRLCGGEGDPEAMFLDDEMAGLESCRAPVISIFGSKWSPQDDKQNGLPF